MAKKSVLKKVSDLINQPKLNLACGKNPIEGFFGVDKVMIEGKVDAVVDLMVYPWPIESDSVEEAICLHYVEHIPHDSLLSYMKKALVDNVSWEDYRNAMLKYNLLVPDEGLLAFGNELYRIMKQGGQVKIVTPYWSSIRCWQDPTHRRAMNEASFLYFNKDWRIANGLDHYNTDANFNYNYGYDFDASLSTKNQEYRDNAAKHYTNSIGDIQYILTKI